MCASWRRTQKLLLMFWVGRLRLTYCSLWKFELLSEQFDYGVPDVSGNWIEQSKRRYRRTRNRFSKNRDGQCRHCSLKCGHCSLLNSAQLLNSAHVFSFSYFFNIDGILLSQFSNLCDSFKNLSSKIGTKHNTATLPCSYLNFDLQSIAINTLGTFSTGINMAEIIKSSVWPTSNTE